VIITRNTSYEAPEGCIVVLSLEEAIKICPKNEEIFIIGGGEIYKQSIDMADKVELTRVHTTVEADTFFPEINPEQWELVFEELHLKDEKHAFDFTFQTFIKANRNS
jgi:dihydrofolate reductase